LIGSAHDDAARSARGGIARLSKICVRTEAPPEAILWCDPAGEFAPILPMLRARLPNLLTLGTYGHGGAFGAASIRREEAQT
jgi:hypothetical protein